MMKKVGVFDSKQLVAIQQGPNGFLEMLPIIFTSDRGLFDKEVFVSDGNRDFGLALVKDIERLEDYITPVEVNINNEAPLVKTDLLVRPSLVAVDRYTASLFNVMIDRKNLSYLHLVEVMRK